MADETLSKIFGFNGYVLKSNSAGMDHADSLRRPAPGGHCCNWILGHILSSRNVVLRLLGQAEIWPDGRDSPYSRGSRPLQEEDGGEALDFTELLRDLATSQERIMKGLAVITAGALAAEATLQLFEGKKDSVGGLLSALAFHEAYHAGQTGLLRSQLGMDGTIP